jgi:hypothetical protein
MNPSATQELRRKPSICFAPGAATSYNKNSKGILKRWCHGIFQPWMEPWSLIDQSKAFSPIT